MIYTYFLPVWAGDINNMTKFSAWHFGVRLKLSLLVGVHQCICLVRFMIQALEDPKLQSTLPESA